MYSNKDLELLARTGFHFNESTGCITFRGEPTGIYKQSGVYFRDTPNYPTEEAHPSLRDALRKHLLEAFV